MIGEADHGLTSAAFSENQYSQAERLFVQFYLHPKQNAAKTLEEGRPIFDDTEYVRIITPGDKDNIIERPARPEDRQRFAPQYQAYRQGHTDAAASGTPLKLWPVLTGAQVAELAYFKVFTIEALADMQDSLLQQFMNGSGLKQKAKDFVEAAKSNAPIARLTHELEIRDANISALEDQIAKLSAKIDKLGKKGKGKDDDDDEEETEE